MNFIILATLILSSLVLIEGQKCSNDWGCWEIGQCCYDHKCGPCKCTNDLDCDWGLRCQKQKCEPCTTCTSYVECPPYLECNHQNDQCESIECTGTDRDCPRGFCCKKSKCEPCGEKCTSSFMCVGGTCCNNQKCGLCGNGDHTVHRIANPTNEKQQRKVTGGGGRYW